MFNEIETSESFEKPITEDYFSYLTERKVISKEYIDALSEGQYGILYENVIYIEDSPYCINCILGKSSESIFDIKGTNSLYGMVSEEGTVFAVLYGDDYLFFKPDDEKIYYKSISTDEVVTLADTYYEFLKLIKIQEEK